MSGENMGNRFASDRIIDAKRRKVIVDKDGNIVNRKPSKEELIGLEEELYTANFHQSKVYTNRELKNELRRFEKEEGRPPTQKDFTNNPEYPNVSTYKRRFGSWSNALKFVGMDIDIKVTQGHLDIEQEKARYAEIKVINQSTCYEFNAGNKYNQMNEEFQDECKRLGLTGNQLTAKYKREGKFVEKGKYKDGKGKSGPQYTDKELLDYPRQFYEKYGRVPAAKDFINNPEYPNVSTYQRRFGSWSNALKFVGMDIDIKVTQGYLDTEQEKARYAEIKVINHFIGHPVDLAGENRNSFCDGICPNGMTYDVKSSKLVEDKYYVFRATNKYKEEIEIYYFLAFNDKHYTKLDYVWRVPGEIVEKDMFYVGLSPSYEFDVEYMDKYDIIDKFGEFAILKEVT